MASSETKEEEEILNSASSAIPCRSHRFLLAGVACLDIINVCPRYPKEDSDLRAVDQEWRRGGNASNSLCVLSQLPASRCSLLAALASGGWETEYVEADLRKNSVDLQHCVKHDGRLPTSYVVLSQETGSRTIVHYRRLPNFSAEDFKRIPLEDFSWVHFEARNVGEVTQMMERVRGHKKENPDQKLTVSLEVEKVRPEAYPLMALGDVVFVSKEVAQDLGCNDAKTAVLELHARCMAHTMLVCAWGSDGADGFCPRTGHAHSGVFPPESLVDTLGAGDTFNAGVMYALDGGASLFKALQLGCCLAGKKCGQMGLDGLLENLSESDPVHKLLALAPAE